jgi:hypothetical protein
MEQKLKIICIVITAVITAPVLVPAYLYHCAMLWREDHHD